MLEDFKLKVFVTVVQERNFTKAAKVLGISQPAVSQNISDLENTLNTKLFERNRGDIALTENGRTFFQYAEKILYWYNSAASMFAIAANTKLEKINILASADVAEFILPDVLASLYAAIPGFCDARYAPASKSASITAFVPTRCGRKRVNSHFSG